MDRSESFFLVLTLVVIIIIVLLAKSLGQALLVVGLVAYALAIVHHLTLMRRGKEKMTLGSVLNRLLIGGPAPRVPSSGGDTSAARNGDPSATQRETFQGGPPSREGCDLPPSASFGGQPKPQAGLPNELYDLPASDPYQDLGWEGKQRDALPPPEGNPFDLNSIAVPRAADACDYSSRAEAVAAMDGDERAAYQIRSRGDGTYREDTGAIRRRSQVKYYMEEELDETADERWMGRYDL